MKYKLNRKMFIRVLRSGSRLFGFESKDVKLTYISIYNISAISVERSELYINLNSNVYFQENYQSEEDAKKMAERIMNYIQACKRNISKDTYLNIGGHYCPDCEEIVNGQVVPRNYKSYKDSQKSKSEVRWDQPTPDSHALAVMKETEKSLDIADRFKKNELNSSSSFL
jgi:hypothetical protein